jgi:hypothetical protein
MFDYDIRWMFVGALVSQTNANCRSRPSFTENNSSTQMYQIKMAGVAYQTGFEM